jgi:acetylglutamate kinase
LGSELESAELELLMPGLSAGMRPKAKATLAAIRAGVGKVHILDGRDDHALLLEIFTSEGIGTQVLP